MSFSVEAASLLSALSLEGVSGLNDDEAGSSGPFTVDVVDSDAEEDEAGSSQPAIVIVESEEEEQDEPFAGADPQPDDGFRTKKRSRENSEGYEQSRQAMILIFQSMPDGATVDQYANQWPLLLAQDYMNEAMRRLNDAILNTPLVAMLLANTDNGNKLRHNMKKLWERMRKIINASRGVYARSKSGLKENRRTRTPRLVAIEKEMKYLSDNVLYTNKGIHKDARDSMDFLIKARTQLEEMLNSRSMNEYRQAPPEGKSAEEYIASVKRESVALAALDDAIRQVGLELSRANRLLPSQRQYLDIQAERDRLEAQRVEQERQRVERERQRAEQERQRALAAAQRTAPPAQAGDSTTDDETDDDMDDEATVLGDYALERLERERIENANEEGGDTADESQPTGPPSPPPVAPSDPPNDGISELNLPPPATVVQEEEDEEDPWGDVEDQQSEEEENPFSFVPEPMSYPESQPESQIPPDSSDEEEEQDEQLPSAGAFADLVAEAEELQEVLEGPMPMSPLTRGTMMGALAAVRTIAENADSFQEDSFYKLFVARRMAKDGPHEEMFAFFSKAITVLKNINQQTADYLESLRPMFDPEGSL